MRRAIASRGRATFLAIAGAAVVAAALLLLLGGGEENSARDSTVPAIAARDDQSKSSETAQAVKRADDFVESVGVNVHLGYTNTAYSRQDLISEKLRDLGVRYIRDGLRPRRPDVYRAWRSLASRGVKVDLIAGDPLRRWGIGPLEDQLAIVKRELRGAVASIEGPNEYDLQGDRNWVSTLREYQRELYRRVKADRALAGIPVVGPTVVRSESNEKLGDISSWLDYGNVHPYPAGLPPERDAELDDELARVALNAGSKRIQATETGYHNALRSAAAHPATPERAAGIYIPRLYLDYFRRGLARTFAYELLDQYPDESLENNEANFGLLRNDFSEKPAFVALKRLISLLQDPGPSFDPDSFDYSVEGGSPSVRQLLLQKRDGSFYLTLWNDASVWDPATRRPLRPVEPSVRLTFAKPVENVELYRPNRSEQPLQRRSNSSSFTLRVSADVAVVKITP